jgi:hypothetical protein
MNDQELERRVAEETARKDAEFARERICSFLNDASADVVKAQNYAKEYNDIEATSQLAHVQRQIKLAWDRLKGN